MTYFVWNIFCEFMKIIYSTDFAIVFYANIKFSSVRICKCTNPFEVFVSPRLFEFYVLIFLMFYNHIKT